MMTMTGLPDFGVGLLGGHWGKLEKKFPTERKKMKVLM